jgi:hypothetical protein
LILIKKGNTATYSFVFKPKSDSKFSFTAQYDITFTQLIDIQNISNISIRVNGVLVLNGLIMSNSIILKSSDIVEIKIIKNNLVTGIFKLIGTTI